MIDIIVVGEDAVTREIARRLLHHSTTAYNIIREEPVRGSQLKSLIPKYNSLGLPVCVLTDLDDSDCPPSLIGEWFKGIPINPNLIFNVACDEAESWLMADKSGFSKFLGIKEESIPGLKKLDARNPVNVELKFSYKPSLYLMRELASKSVKKDILRRLTPRLGAKKGPEYNTVLLPFIRKHWDIDAAIRNSYSLGKAVKRIARFSPT
jgi:hypothetical protein